MRAHLFLPLCGQLFVRCTVATQVFRQCHLNGGRSARHKKSIFHFLRHKQTECVQEEIDVHGRVHEFQFGRLAGVVLPAEHRSETSSEFYAMRFECGNECAA